MKFQLPDLPYAKNSLAPFMSEETLNFHYGKHHNGYVNNLNTLLESSENQAYANKTLEQIVTSAKGGLFNNAAQHWNHSFFWNSLSPKKSAIPSEIEKNLQSAFGSLDAFKEKFVDSGVKQFGSGWVWLVVDSKGNFKITSTSNAENPLTQGDQPLLTMDVWEHAYYIDYRNDRKKFLSTWWDHVNWDFALANLKKA